MNLEKITAEMDEIVKNLPRSAAIQHLERISAEAKQRIINLNEAEWREPSKVG